MTEISSISSTTSGFPPKRRRNASQLSRLSFVSDVESLAPSSFPGSDDENDETYRAKRNRNNAAVQKSRAKAKVKAGQSEVHLRQLREENQLLEKRQEKLTKELEMLKESFLRQMQEQIQKGRAFDAMTRGDSSDVDNDGDNDGDVNGQSIFSSEALYFLGATENGFPRFVASDADAVAVANVVASPAPAVSTVLKDDVGANTTISAQDPATAPAMASLGKLIDLKKEKEQRRKNNKGCNDHGNHSRLWLKSASL